MKSSASRDTHTDRQRGACQLGTDLFGRLVEGHGGVDELQAVLHLQHQLLPVDGHLLSAAPDRLGIIVTRLQHHLQETRRNTQRGKMMAGHKVLYLLPSSARMKDEGESDPHIITQHAPPLKRGSDADRNNLDIMEHTMLGASL